MLKKRYCLNGHDTDIYGRYTNSGCKECDRQRRHTNTFVDIKRRYTQSDKGKSTTLKYLHGITREEYDKKLIEQDGKCAICKEPFTGIPQVGVPHIDHDHKCCPGRKSCGKCIRGLVHLKCNIRLGIIESRTENEDAYLEYWNSVAL